MTLRKANQGKNSNKKDLVLTLKKSQEFLAFIHLRRYATTYLNLSSVPNTESLLLNSFGDL